MSFNRILALLPDAFSRIDRSHELTRKRSNDTVMTAMSSVLVGYDGQYKIECRDDVIVVFTESAILKHYIHQRQDYILDKLRDSIQQCGIKSVSFKGPRQ